MLALAVLVAIGVCGLGALVAGIRGRRIDDHPVCRRCRFDLVGVYPAIGSCPECGSVLNEAARVRIGQRRRRPVLIAFGAVVALAGVTGGGAWVWAMNSGVDLNRHKPVWVLRLEAELGSVARADAALTELLRRSDAGELNGAQRRRIAQSALLVQSDGDAVWNVKWGDLFESAWLDGVVGEDFTRRYARGSVRFALKTRPTVARGSHLSARLEVRSRVGTRKTLQWEMINYGLRLGDDPADPPTVINKRTLPVGLRDVRAPMAPVVIGLAPVGPVALPPGDAVSEVVLSEALDAAVGVVTVGAAADAHGRITAPTGECRARSRFIVSVRAVGSRGANWVGWSAAAPLEKRPNWDMACWAEMPMAAEGDDLASWRVEVSAPVRVVEAGEFDVALVPDPERVAGSKSRGLRRHAEAGTVWGDLLVPAGELDLALEVFVRVGDRDIPIGPAVIRGAPADTIYPGWGGAVYGVGGAVRLPDEVRVVDIVVRSSPRVAAATVDMRRIWDGEFVIRDVPVSVGGNYGGW